MDSMGVENSATQLLVCLEDYFHLEMVPGPFSGGMLISRVYPPWKD